MSTRSPWPVSVAVLLLIAAAICVALRPTTAGDASTLLLSQARSPAQCFNPAANIPLTGETCGLSSVSECSMTSVTVLAAINGR